jgi:acetoin utilization deacetylase AcuC-like enzyme
VAEPAKLADVLKVHDYRYIKDVMKKCAALENHSSNLGKYDRDSVISSETWTAALMASGAVLEACDKVMAGEHKNAFCAIRPPGHHAGVFGKTFRRNACDQE